MRRPTTTTTLPQFLRTADFHTGSEYVRGVVGADNTRDTRGSSVMYCSPSISLMVVGLLVLVGMVVLVVLVVLVVH